MNHQKGNTMARKDTKNKYQGYKAFGDTQEAREARAKKNAAGNQTNEVTAVSDGEFKAACEKASVNPTSRQASKFRNGYGLAARAVGKNTRKDPKV